MATNRRGRATRELLLDVVDELLAERGLDLTVEEVAATAGVSRPTVYRHVGDRSDLLTSALMRTAETHAAELSRILSADRPFADRLVDAITATVTEAERNASVRGALRGQNPGEAWPGFDPDGRFVSAAKRFYLPWFEAAAAEGVRFRADLDETIDWLLRQILMIILVPSARGSGLDVIRHETRTFVIPTLIAG